MTEKQLRDDPQGASGYFRPDGAEEWDEIEKVGKVDPHQIGIKDHTDPKHREYFKEILLADVKELHKGPEQRGAAAEPANEVRSVLSQNKKR